MTAPDGAATAAVTSAGRVHARRPLSPGAEPGSHGSRGTAQVTAAWSGRWVLVVVNSKCWRVAPSQARNLARALEVCAVAAEEERASGEDEP